MIGSGEKPRIIIPWVAFLRARFTHRRFEKRREHLGNLAEGEIAVVPVRGIADYERK
jgi:hypothetical protein